MGEIQGSVWTTMLFVIVFFGVVGIILWALNIMEYNSTLYTIEDNIRAEGYKNPYDSNEQNYAVFSTLDERFTPCLELINQPADECTGVTEINTEKHYVKYQVSYNGAMFSKSSTETNNIIVQLPY